MMKALSIHKDKEITILGANDGFPFVREAVRLFRNACKTNAHTRWLPPKQLLSKDAQQSSLPLSWTVSLPDRGIVSITPDEIIGFDVEGSTRRILLLCVDYGGAPISSEFGDSLLLRTQALAVARSLIVPGQYRPMYELRRGKVLIAWFMWGDSRLQALKRHCRENGYPNVVFINAERFENANDVFSLEWHHVDCAPHTLI